MKTYLLTYEAKPNWPNLQLGKVSRALCAFWITDEEQEEAQRRAVAYGHEMGWTFSNWIRITSASRQDFNSDSHLLDRFDSAQRDGAACMINLIR